MTAADHYNAVKAQLAGGILASRVYDVVRVNGSTPVRDNYVVLLPESWRLDDERYTALQVVDSTAVYGFDVKSVATSVSGLLLYQDTVRARMLGTTLNVEGRTCDPIRLVPAVEEGRMQHDATANIFHLTETFEFTSRRA